MRFGNINMCDPLNMSLELFSDSGNTIDMYQANIDVNEFCGEIQSVHLLIDDCMDIIIDKEFKTVSSAKRFALEYLDKLIQNLKSQQNGSK